MTVENRLNERLLYYSNLATGHIVDYINSGGMEAGVKDAMLYSLPGGKQLRPALLLGAYEAFNDGSLAKALPFAGAIEMIHTYSLVHDDLPAMDDDDIRRGRPSNHIKFGEAMAVLAGDALLNTAAEIMMESLEDSGAEGIRAATIIMKAAGPRGMIGGQSLDLAGADTERELKKMYSMKTGALLRAAAVSGAVLGGCSRSDERHIGEFAEKAGYAFQIKDDLLDVYGNEDVTGKPKGSDERNHKVTFVSLLGVEKSEKLLKEVASEAIGELDGIMEDTWFLRELMEYIVSREG